MCAKKKAGSLAWPAIAHSSSGYPTARPITLPIVLRFWNKIFSFFSTFRWKAIFNSFLDGEGRPVLFFYIHKSPTHVSPYQWPSVWNWKNRSVYISPRNIQRFASLLGGAGRERETDTRVSPDPFLHQSDVDTHNGTCRCCFRHPFFLSTWLTNQIRGGRCLWFDWLCVCTGVCACIPLPVFFFFFFSEEKGQHSRTNDSLCFFLEVMLPGIGRLFD